jgi:GntR family transcriptional regulator
MPRATPDPKVTAPEGGRKRYRRLAGELLAEIKAGAWPVGALLPSEPELAARWSLSRYGVREVIQGLADLGVVSREHGIGTRVIADKERVRYTQKSRSLDDLAEYTRETRLSILEKGRFKPSGATQSMLLSHPGEEWLRLRALRHVGPAAIAYALVYINPRYSRISFGRELRAPLFSLIERAYDVRISLVEQEIQAVLVAADAARLLGVQQDSAALRVVRRYFVGSEVVEVTDAVHPHFTYSMSFEVEATGRLAPGV